MRKSIKRAFVASIATATSLAGAVVMTTSPAEAALSKYTNYGFEGAAFGTYAATGQVGVTSGRTAHSFMGCTRRVGVTINRSVATVATNPYLNIGGVATFTKTYRLANGTVGERSQAAVAAVTLGDPNGVNIQIKGLKTTTNAFATKDKKFHTSVSFTSADIAANTGTPLDDVLNMAGATIGDLLKAVTDAAGGVLTIPGLGEIKLGGTSTKKFYSYAEANAVALNVQLYGPDSAKGGGDDIIVRVGRSRSRINRNTTSGVFRGFAQPATATLVENLLQVGPLGEQRLGCQGTNGQVRSNAVAGIDLGNAGLIKVGGVEGSVYGLQKSDGSAKAWARAKVAGIKLGNADSSLEIKGIIGQANVTKYPSGKVSRGIGGSTILSLIVNGEAHPIPVPGDTIEIPGLARIEFMVVSKPTLRDIKVTAIRITLLDDTPGVVVVNLGVAKAGITDF